jgi:hypothetical protein
MIPIGDQIEEVERQARSLERFPGRMLPETVDRKLAHLGAAAATLRIIAQHADGLRALIKHLQRAAASDTAPEPPSPDETAALLAHPAVAELILNFPEAVLVGIAAVTSPALDAASLGTTARGHGASEAPSEEEAA